ncbi:putative membrane protein [Nocardiopsis arvandica]|uniref:Putative membrane protein n=1 Tax=Nocardiopsis sinuspersici TaxID=501010 RepID=A0A7Z0BN68_9ACTN|nr:SHOCT domain-containing protein [Nocardiopsis sinuspersici]NYH55189.1 putative membrane protein [Nocardiopsis sinuspersici]
MTYMVATLVILVMVALGVFFVVTVASVAGAALDGHTRADRRSPSASPGSQAVDAAEEELRLRYARGEIDREEFLQRKIDLER